MKLFLKIYFVWLALTCVAAWVENGLHNGAYWTGYLVFGPLIYSGIVRLGVWAYRKVARWVRRLRPVSTDQVEWPS